jgi:hypothetical protein
VEPGTPDWGRALEHRVFCDLRAAIDHLGSTAKLECWRSLSQGSRTEPISRGS